MMIAINIMGVKISLATTVENSSATNVKLKREFQV